VTLITAAANFAFVVQVADRRLSDGKGPLEEEQAKAIHLRLPRADFLVGYTGLAKIQDKPMNRVLMELLYKSAERGSFEPLATAEAITSHLTTLFQGRSVRAYRPQDRRLSVMMTGFHRVDDQHHALIQGLWTNFQDWGSDDSAEAWDRFAFTPFSVRPGVKWPTLVQRIGAYDALSLETVEEGLRPLLADAKPPTAIRDKMIRMLPAQSELHPTVGVNANAAILFPNGLVEWSYWTGAPSWTYSGGNTVLAIPGQSLLAADVEIYASDQAGNPLRTGRPLSVPQVPRNKPCPCGSGRRYRQCHGRDLGRFPQ